MGVRQDMPPPGGFQSINYQRVCLKKYWPSPIKWCLMFGVTIFGSVLYARDKKKIFHDFIEKRSARISLYPLLLAENDRFKLRQYRRNRDLEAELMKDVEGWVVGTYKGEPVFKSLEPEDWYEPMDIEYFAHADPSLHTSLVNINHYA